MLSRLPLFLTLLAAGLAIGPTITRAADKGSDEEKSAFDKRFIKEAAQYSYAENEISRLAREQSRSDGVKHYAEIIIGGHKKLLDELHDIARDHNYTLSDDLTDKQKDTKDRLSKLEGTDFDVQYMSSEVQDHEAIVALFERGSKECQDKDLREFADRRLPALRGHLDNARELYKKVKNKER